MKVKELLGNARPQSWLLGHAVYTYTTADLTQKPTFKCGFGFALATSITFLTDAMTKMDNQMCNF